MNDNLSPDQFEDYEPGHTGEMPAHQFAKTFKPAYYSNTWKNVEHDSNFQSGGDNGEVDMGGLSDSLRQHGMKHHVQVVGDEVTEGHHRVVAALHANVPVRYQRW